MSTTSPLPTYSQQPVTVSRNIYDTWLWQQYRLTLIVMSILTIIFHPAFHFILGLLPDIPSDSLPLRLLSASVSLVILGIVLLFPHISRYGPLLQVINAGTALAVTHLLVFDTNNHPMYLAAALTAIYGAQLSFVRVREWIITVVVIAMIYGVVATQRGDFATGEGFMPLLFFGANYIISTALVAVRGRIQYRELQTRLALEQTNQDLRVATDRLHNELVLARDIQQSLLPPPSPAWPALDVVCYSQAAREVGGDFYSYYHFGSRVALAVGDVSGKGVSAALLMATSISLLNEYAIQHEQPDALLINLDQRLLPYTQPRGQNCALCYVELANGTLSIVNAAGIPPYVLRVNGSVEWPEVGGFALGHGLGAQTGYQQETIMVERGDLIVMVSDGMVEAKNRHGELFGFGRVESALQAGPTTSAQAMVTFLHNAVEAFADVAEPHDDMTIIVMRVGG